MKKIEAYGICLYKVDNKSIKVLLCKSKKSLERWGFLKGVSHSDEQPEKTALREFKEESNIKVGLEELKEFFIQKNELKDIGIYLVSYNKSFDKYFNQDILDKENLSEENTDVEFFDIEELPLIKKKQNNLTKEIITHLKKM